MEIEFFIKGKPKAKQSVKFTRKGIKYTPGDIKEYANWVRLCFLNSFPAWSALEFKDKSLKVELNVYMAIPKGFSKKKFAKALKGELRPIVKPDCDNIAKNINDALNGLLYPDDKQIVSLTVNKFYSVTEGVNVKVGALNDVI